MWINPFLPVAMSRGLKRSAELAAVPMRTQSITPEAGLKRM